MRGAGGDGFDHGLGELQLGRVAKDVCPEEGLRRNPSRAEIRLSSDDWSFLRGFFATTSSFSRT
jgi:hypothetical protein